MKNPFAKTNERPMRVSSGQLQAMLNLHQQDLLTGLLSFNVVGEPDEYFALIYVEGKPVLLYHAKGQEITRLPGENRGILYAKGQLDMWLMPLSARCVPAIQIVLEQAAQASPRDMTTAEIPSYLDKLNTLPDPQLVMMQWPSATGFVVLPGSNLTGRQILFIRHEQNNLQTASVLPSLPRWAEPSCLVTQLKASPDIMAWQTNLLGMAFAQFVEQFLTRYEELVGDSLRRRLEENLNTLTRLRAWQINFIARSVDDTHYFPTLKDMSDGYNTLLQACTRQMDSVVGPKLVRDAIMSSSRRLPQPMLHALNSVEAITQATK